MFIKHLIAFITVPFLLSEVLFVEVSFTMPSKDRARKDKKKGLLLDRKEKYTKEGRSKRHNDDYYTDIEASRLKSAESSKKTYYKNPSKYRANVVERVKDHYYKDIEKSRADAVEFQCHVLFNSGISISCTPYPTR